MEKPAPLLPDLHPWERILLRLIRDADGEIGFDDLAKRLKRKIFPESPRTAGIYANTERFVSALVRRKFVEETVTEANRTFHITSLGRSIL